MLMDPANLQQYEERCIQQRSPACMAGCLAHVDARQMANLIAEGKFNEAFKLLQKQIPFPGIIAYACEHPCQSVCVRKDCGGAIRIHDLEKAAVTYGYQSLKLILPPKKKYKIAIVGGGMTGISAAYEMGKKGYPITLWEAKEGLGGSLTNVPQDVLERDLSILQKAKIEIRLGQTLTLAEALALKEEFDAVLLAPGKGFALPETLPEGVFAAGSVLRPDEAPQPLRALKDGQNAVRKIESYLTGATFQEIAAREEPLIPSLDDIERKSPIESQNGVSYSKEEAKQEGARCIRCSCLECMKVCPYLRYFKEYPGTCIRSIIKNIKMMPDTGYRNFNKLILSCSLCGLCGEVCPGDINMAEVNLQAREMLFERDYLAPAIHDFPIRDMQQANGEDASLQRGQIGKEKSKYYFFPGCQLSASRPDLVQKSYAYLKGKLASDGVGIFLHCCGVPAIWSGRMDDEKKSKEELLSLWQKEGQPELICACPSCYKTFQEHYPDVKVHFIGEFLQKEDAAVKDGRTLAIHDACSARYEKELQQQVRGIATSCGNLVEELPMDGKNTTCCGYGGLMYHVAPHIMKDVIGERIAQSDLPYLTYCINCRDFFRRYGKDAVYWLDLFFGCEDEAYAKPGPNLSLRQENRIRLKNDFLCKEFGEEVAEKQERLQLILSDEIKEKMEQNFILEEDLIVTISYAENTGRMVYLPEKDCFAAHYQPKIITYWVEYRKEKDGGYRILNTYSHRIQLEGEDTVD